MTRRRTQVDRDIECRQALKHEIQEYFSRAKRGVFPTHDEMLAWRQERIFNTKGYSKLPGTCKSFLQGCWEILHDLLYREDLEWRVSLDGQLILGSEVPAGRWGDVDVHAGARVWRNSRDLERF